MIYKKNILFLRKLLWKFCWPPFFLSSNECLLYSNEPTLKYGFKAANHKLGAEISSDIQIQILTVWFGWTIFRTSWRISQPHKFGSIYVLLHWNRVAKPSFNDKNLKGGQQISIAISSWVKYFGQNI